MFVIPRFAVPGQFYNYPIGLAYVYAFLKRHGVSVSCLNLCHESENTYVLLKREFGKRHVDIICTGGMSSHWELIEDILVSAKLIDRNVIAVVGGAIVTADPELSMANLPIDYGVIGEGEYTLIELLESIQRQTHPSKVKGLIFKNPEGKLVLTEKREEIKDLDSLPIPERQDFGFREMMGNIKYAQQIPILETLRYAEIIGSRSCPFSCTFCYHPLGKKYRQRSLDHIFSEIDYLHRTFGANVIAFNDEFLSNDQIRLSALAKRIKPYNIKWTAQFRVTNVQREVMEELADSGLTVARFGIESMNDEVLKSMEKHTSRADIINALEICRQANIACAGNIILGDPADTVETANESIEWWKKNSFYQIGLDFIRVVPDAPIYRLALERRRIKNKLAHVKSLPLINLSKMSDRQYYALVPKVCWWNLLCKYIIPGILISTRRLDECIAGRNFYELKLRCPCCGNEHVYKKLMILPVPNMVNICLGCFANFKISQKQAFPGDYSSVATFRYMLIKLVGAYMMRFSFFRNYSHVLKKYLKRYSTKL
jgi:radical SAM superfamily enzyme YgiQ (UPF0313 family)